MSTPKYDLTACVEAGARAFWSHKWPDHEAPDWGDVNPIIKHGAREHVLPIVTAVLGVVEAGE